MTGQTVPVDSADPQIEWLPRLWARGPRRRGSQGSGLIDAGNIVEEVMRSMRVPISVALTVVVLVGAVAAPAVAQPTGSAVTEWNRIAVNTLVAFPPRAGGVPPSLQIHVAMAQGAVYDAINAIEPKHFRPYLLERRFSSKSSRDAAVATAAYRVLADIIATVPSSIPFPNRDSLRQGLDTAYADALAAIPNGKRKKHGIAAGTAAAAAMIAARLGDGRFGPSAWQPNAAPGHWQPLLSPEAVPILDPTPWVGNVRPFLIESSSQFRTAGPLAMDTAAWAAEFNEVKALGSATSVVRTADQTHIARFWQSSVPPAWNEVARNLLEDPQYDVGLADSARLLAMMNLSAADAAINCWNDKYHWDFWRPWNAIPRGADDGNPATEADASWTALIAAPYPEHPSGHLCLDGAHTGALTEFFGTDEIQFGVTSVPFPGEVRLYDSFSAALDEIVEARIWAGLHYRTADVQARMLGANVADYMTEHYFQGVGARP
jgi:hypothetical protein